MHRNRSVDVHQFSMIPRADIPRSSFRIQKAHKTTFDAGYLIPIYVDEVLPGDTFNLKMTAFARMATPIYPLMDNLYLDSFFFFVPCRLVWSNWKKFMGEQANPGDSTSYVIPVVETPSGGWTANSIGDYFGLPTAGQFAPTDTTTHNVLPLRAYNLIWNEWFRDENLQNSVVVNTGDSGDTASQYTLLRRGKRHDYFTSCLPFPQKGASVTLPLGTSAPISGIGVLPSATTAAGVTVKDSTTTSAGVVYANSANAGPDPVTDGVFYMRMSGSGTGAIPNIYADLSQATAATINQLRQSFQIQRLLERDARGGTRYTEIVRSHFGVISPDARLQRPEYLGGGSTPVAINAIAQTSATDVTGSATPLGNLAAMATVVTRQNGFTQSFTEHGYVIGLVGVRADLTYQQGIRKLWKRSTRYDFYFPAFAHLGEQAVLRQEIYVVGQATDTEVFGYQERWAEYRYNPSQISGLFRSTDPNTIDGWHLAQYFSTAPTLGDTFIQENPPMERVLAVGSAAGGQQFIFDSFFDIVAARPMPMYSVPGLIDHF